MIPSDDPRPQALECRARHGRGAYLAQRTGAADERRSAGISAVIDPRRISRSGSSSTAWCRDASCARSDCIATQLTGRSSMAAVRPLLRGAHTDRLTLGGRALHRPRHQHRTQWPMLWSVLVAALIVWGMKGPARALHHAPARPRLLARHRRRLDDAAAADLLGAQARSLAALDRRRSRHGSGCT